MTPVVLAILLSVSLPNVHLCGHVSAREPESNGTSPHLFTGCRVTDVWNEDIHVNLSTFREFFYRRPEQHRDTIEALPEDVHLHRVRCQVNIWPLVDGSKPRPSTNFVHIGRNTRYLPHIKLDEYRTLGTTNQPKVVGVDVGPAGVRELPLYSLRVSSSSVGASLAYLDCVLSNSSTVLSNGSTLFIGQHESMCSVHEKAVEGDEQDVEYGVQEWLLLILGAVVPVIAMIERMECCAEAALDVARHWPPKKRE